MRRALEKIIALIVSVCLLASCMPAAALGSTVDPYVSRSTTFTDQGESGVRVLSMDPFRVEAWTKDGLKFESVEQALEMLSAEESDGVARIRAKAFGGAEVVEWEWTRTVDGHAVEGERAPFTGHSGSDFWVNLEERDLAPNTFYTYTLWAKDANGYEDSCTITFMVLNKTPIDPDPTQDYEERTIYSDGSDDPEDPGPYPAIHGVLVHVNAELTVTDASAATKDQLKGLVPGEPDASGTVWELGDDAWNLDLQVSGGTAALGPSVGPLDVMLPVDVSRLPEGATTVLAVGIDADGNTVQKELPVLTDENGNAYVTFEVPQGQLGSYGVAYPVLPGAQVTITAASTAGGSVGYAGTRTWNVDAAPVYALTPDPFCALESVTISVDGAAVDEEALAAAGVVAEYDFIVMDIQAILEAAGVAADDRGGQRIVLDAAFAPKMPLQESFKLTVMDAPGGHVEVLVNGSPWAPGQAVPSDAVIQFTFVPDGGWEFTQAVFDEAGREGQVIAPAGTYTISGLTGDLTVTPTFTYTGSSWEPPAIAYEVIASVAQGSVDRGTVNGAASATARVFEGQTASFTIAPAPGYEVATVTDGAGRNLKDYLSVASSASAPVTLSVPNVRERTEVTITFREVPEFIEVNASVRLNVETIGDGYGALVIPESVVLPRGSSSTFYIVPESEKYVLEGAWYSGASSEKYTNVMSKMEWVPDPELDEQYSDVSYVGQQNRAVDLDAARDGDEVADDVSYGYYRITLDDLVEDAELIVQFRAWVPGEDDAADTPKRSGTKRWREVSIESNVTEQSGVVSPVNRTLRVPASAAVNITVKPKTADGWALESIFSEELESGQPFATAAEPQDLKDQVHDSVFTVEPPDSGNSQHVTVTFARGQVVVPDPGTNEESTQYTITPVVEGSGGTVYPAEAVTVPKGASYSFAFFRNIGYRVQSVRANSMAIDFSQKGCTVTDVRSDITLRITFGTATAADYLTPVERAYKTLQALAKTGDLNLPTILLLMALASGAGGVLLLLGGGRRRREDEPAVAAAVAGGGSGGIALADATFDEVISDDAPDPEDG